MSAIEKITDEELKLDLEIRLKHWIKRRESYKITHPNEPKYVASCNSIINEIKELMK